MGRSGTVKLSSSDKEVFEVDIKVAEISALLKSMIETAGTEDEIPVPNVKSATLKKVIEYCTMHKDSIPAEIRKPLSSSNLAEAGVSEQDIKFLDMDLESLFELILAANFLNIKSLLDLTCGKIASMIKGKKVEQIREAFNIVNDFTPEQEAQVREENKWCEDS